MPRSKNKKYMEKKLTRMRMNSTVNNFASACSSLSPSLSCMETCAVMHTEVYEGLVESLKEISQYQIKGVLKVSIHSSYNLEAHLYLKGLNGSMG